MNFQLGRQEGNRIVLRYEMDQAFYARNDVQDHRDHLLSLITHLQGHRISLDGNDSVQFLSGILGGGFGVGQSGQRVDRTTFLDHYRLEYRLSEKLSSYADGSYDATDYKEGTSLYDANTWRGTVGFAFNVTPKVRVFGEGYYGQSAVDPNRSIDPKGPHLDTLGGFIGASGEFHPKLTGTVKGGYETRSYGNSSDEIATPVVEASLTGKIDDKTTASLNYSRRSSVSVQTANQSYASDVVTAGLGRVLSSDGKLVARLGGSFELDTYEDFGAFSRRNDKHYRASFGLTYNLQLWLSTSIAYEFEKYVSSDRTIIDYDVNRVTLRVSVGY